MIERREFIKKSVIGTAGIAVGGIGLSAKSYASIIGANEKNKLMIEHLENKRLTEITEAKMRFFTNISHEIRTPLTLINDPLNQVLQNGRIDDTSRKHLNLISKNVNRLLNLANQLLLFLLVL